MAMTMTSMAIAARALLAEPLVQYGTADDDQQDEEYKNDTCTCETAITASNFGHLIITPFVWRN